MKIESACVHISHLLDLWIPWKIQYDRTPGISIGLFHKGNLFYKGGFGFSDVQRKKRTGADTLYRVASLSKMFTAVALLQLQGRGLVRLDDLVSRYLPWFRGKNRNGNLGRVTIRHLLSHTSGLFRDGEKPYWDTHRFPEDVSKTIGRRSIIFKHATQFKYSNHAFAVLGELIKKVSGLSFGAYAQRNIFDVLGMTLTYPDFSPDVLRGLARGYGRVLPDKGNREIFPVAIRTRAYAPAAGIISNVPDLACFMSGIALRSSGPQILTERSKYEMMKPREKTVGGNRYGLGLQIKRISKKRMVGHSGGFAGYATCAILNPVDGIGAICLSNSLSGDIDLIGEGILSILSYIISLPSSSNSDNKGNNKYEGVYRGRWSDVVIAGAGRLLIAFDAETNNPLKNHALLKPVGRHAFRIETKNLYDTVGETATFTSLRNGKFQRLIWGTDPKIRST